MPPTAGEGIGIDRAGHALRRSAVDPREVILFPHLRPESARLVKRSLPYELFLGFRYLGSRAIRANLSLFAWIRRGQRVPRRGPPALILVVAVMTGFQDGIRDRIILAKPAPARLPDGRRRHERSRPGGGAACGRCRASRAATPFVLQQAAAHQPRRRKPTAVSSAAGHRRQLRDGRSERAERAAEGGRAR